MFMEILYKQTALFPLSSCRYKAVVTFFIDRLKHLAMPRGPHPGWICYPSPPTLTSWDAAVMTSRCSAALDPSWIPSP